jgi:hypothetical protein
LIAGVLGLAFGAALGAAAGPAAKTVTDAGLRAETVTAPGHTKTVNHYIVHNHVVVHVHTQTITTSAAPSSATPSSSPEIGAGDEVGSSSHATDSEFCEEHECIGSFETEEGSIVECADGTYSHAGGISGACSDHGGEA